MGVGSRKPEAGGCGMGAAERPAMPDRKGFPHPCGSATPSVAWTLCSSGIASLSRWDYGVALSSYGQACTQAFLFTDSWLLSLS